MVSKYLSKLTPIKKPTTTVASIENASAILNLLAIDYKIVFSLKNYSMYLLNVVLSFFI